MGSILFDFTTAACLCSTAGARSGGPVAIQLFLGWRPSLCVDAVGLYGRKRRRRRGEKKTKNNKGGKSRNHSPSRIWEGRREEKKGRPWPMVPATVDVLLGWDK